MIKDCPNKLIQRTASATDIQCVGRTKLQKTDITEEDL